MGLDGAGRGGRPRHAPLAAVPPAAQVVRWAAHRQWRERRRQRGGGVGRRHRHSGLRGRAARDARRHRGEHRGFSSPLARQGAHDAHRLHPGAGRDDGHPTPRLVDRRRDRRDRRDLVRRRTRDGFRSLGAFAQHADARADGVHAGVAADGPCGRHAGRSGVRAGRLRLHRDRARADGPRRRQRPPSDGERVLSRTGRLSLGHRAFQRTRNRHRRNLWRGNPAASGAVGTVAGGAWAAADRPAREPRAYASGRDDRRPARRSRRARRGAIRHAAPARGADRANDADAYGRSLPRGRARYSTSEPGPARPQKAPHARRPHARPRCAAARSRARGGARRDRRSDPRGRRRDRAPSRLCAQPDSPAGKDPARRRGGGSGDRLGGYGRVPDPSHVPSARF